MQDKDTLKELIDSKLSAYAFGAELGRKTILGPLLVGVQWCDKTGFSGSFSFGFNF